jgi:hypothetical protein
MSALFYYKEIKRKVKQKFSGRNELYEIGDFQLAKGYWLEYNKIEKPPGSCFPAEERKYYGRTICNERNADRRDRQ